MSNLIEKFNPKTIGQLNEKELIELQNLTHEEIGQLAEAYPNSTNGQNYLAAIYDGKYEVQVPTGTSFPNVYDLNKRNLPNKFKIVGTVASIVANGSNFTQPTKDVVINHGKVAAVPFEIGKVAKEEKVKEEEVKEEAPKKEVTKKKK